MKNILIKYITPVLNTCVYAPVSTGVIALISFLAPLNMFFGVLIYFVILDFCTGIVAAYKENQKITSYKMRFTIGKLFGYFTIIIGCYLIERALNIDVNAPGVLCAVISLTEFYSILENFGRMGVPIGNIKKTIEKIFKK